MATSTPSRILFPDQLLKPVQVEFEAESLTSDGGAPLLGALDESVGLTALLATRTATTHLRSEVTPG